MSKHRGNQLHKYWQLKAGLLLDTKKLHGQRGRQGDGDQTTPPGTVPGRGTQVKASHVTRTSIQKENSGSEQTTNGNGKIPKQMFIAEAAGEQERHYSESLVTGVKQKMTFPKVKLP